MHGCGSRRENLPFLVNNPGEKVAERSPFSAADGRVFWTRQKEEQKIALFVFFVPLRGGVGNPALPRARHRFGQARGPWAVAPDGARGTMRQESGEKP